MDICKGFRDLILTDYIDGEADAAIRKRIDEHLLRCPGCRALVKEVQENLIRPFSPDEREPVPEEVWSSIREKIGNETAVSKTVVKDLIGRWLEFFIWPRLSLVLGNFVMLILIGAVVFHQQQIQQAKEKEQGAYLVYLFGTNEVSPETENNGGDTSIEKYFL